MSVLLVMGMGLFMWIGFCLLVLGVCVSAKEGDRAGGEPATPLSAAASARRRRRTRRRAAALS